ncbi:MAG: preprotein translocase subunit SecG [Betaproteobacteria bacterium]|nr:MAG: preprotein translocase subunit SecG [Betaproteobacteria bacterium]
MEIVLLVVHVLVGTSVIGLVLLQHGKGADMGAAFGSGSAGSLFGASGSANFLSRTTAILATMFFITSMGLTYIGSTHTESKGVIERPKESQEVPKPTPSAPPSSTVPAPSAPSEGGSKASDVPK